MPLPELDPLPAPAPSEELDPLPPVMAPDAAVSPVEEIIRDNETAPPDLPAHGPDTGTTLRQALQTADGPTPRDTAGAIREWAARGVFVDGSVASLGPHIDGLANSYTKSVFTKLGLWSPGGGFSKDVSDDLHTELNGAIRGLLVRQFSPLTDEERGAVERRAMRTAMQKAEQTGLLRLQQLQAEGRGPEDPAVVRWQELAAKARMLSNRTDDPEYLSAFRDQAVAAAFEFDKARAQADPELRAQLGLTSELFELGTKFTPEFAHKHGRASLQPGFREWTFTKKERLVNEVISSMLEDAQDTSARSRFFANSLLGSVQAVRTEEMLGLPADAAAELGSVRILGKTHRRLFAKLIDAQVATSARREMGAALDGGAPGAAREFQELQRNHLAGAIASFWGSETPLLKSAQSATFSPQALSAPEAVANTADAIKESVGLTLRAAVDAVAVARRTIMDGVVRSVQDLEEGFVPSVPVEAMSMEDARDHVAKRGVFSRALTQSSPHVLSLAKDVEDGILSWATVNSIVNPKNDILLASAILSTPSLFDTTQRTLLELGRKGVSNEAARNFWEDAVGKVYSEIQTTGIGTFGQLGTPENTDRAFARWSVAARNNDLFGAMVGLADWGVNSMVGETRDVYSLLRTDPGQVVDSVAVGYALGVAAGPVVRQGLETAQAARMRVNRAVNMRRARQALQDTVALDAPAARRVLEGAKTLRIDTPEDLEEVLSSVIGALENVVKAHKTDLNRAHRGKPSLDSPIPTDSLHVLRRGLRDLDNDVTLRLLEKGGVEKDILNAAFVDRIRPLIPELADAVKESLGFWGTKVQPWVAKNAPRVFSAVEEAFRAGKIGPDQTRLISLLSVRDARKLRGRSRLALEKLPNTVRRTLDMDEKLEGTAPYVGDAIDVVSHTVPLLNGYRIVAGEARSAAESFLTMLRDSRVRRAENLRQSGLNPEAAFDEAVAANRLWRQTRDIDLTEHVKFDQQPLLDSVSIPEIRAWADSWESPGGSFYARMRNKGESEAAFNSRAASLTDEAATAFRKRFAREYLNAPGIRDTFNVDSWNQNIPIAGAKAKRLRSERGAVRNQIAKIESLRASGAPETRIASAEARLERLTRLVESDPGGKEFLAALREDPEAASLGIGKANLGKAWEKIEGYAYAEKTDVLLGVMERAQDIGLDPAASVQALRSALIENKMNVTGFLEHQSRLAGALASASPEVKTAVDLALRAQAEEGDYLSIEQLRKKHPEVFRDLPEAGEAAVERFLRTDRNMRASLLSTLRDAEVITDGELARYSRPYTPRQFRHFIDRKLMSVDLDERAVGALNSVGDELLAKAEIDSFKLTVRRRNGGYEDLKFSTEEDAVAYMERVHGVKESSRQDGELQGTTRNDDSFLIQKPIGADVADALEEISVGASLVDRLMSLSNTASVARAAQIMDRPGLTFTAAQFEKFRKTPRGRQLEQDFEQLGPDRKFGRLRNKWVHHKVKSALDDSQEMADVVQETYELTSESLNTQDRILRSLMRGTKRATYTAVSFFKNRIAANEIFRKPRTQLVNFLTDYSYFARVAAGDDGWWFSAEASQAGKAAWRAVFGSDETFLKELDADPDLQLALDRNVFDESLAGPFMVGKGRTAVRRLILGEDRSEFGRFMDGLHEGGMKQAIRDMLDPAANPVIKNLQSRVTKIEKILKEQQIGLGDPEFTPLPEKVLEGLAEELAQKRKILARQTGKLRGVYRFADIAGWALQGKRFGKQGIGTFGDTNILSQELYQRQANWNRYRVFKYLRNKGVDADTAAKRVSTYMQTYSSVPKALREFGRSPFGSPIMSFPWELVRTTKNTMRDHPGTYIGLQSAIPLYNIAAIGMAGHNPEHVLRELSNHSGGLPGWTALFNGVVTARDDGTFGYTELPVIEPFLLARSKPGVLSSVGTDDVIELSAAEQFGAAARNVVFGQTLNNPLLNYGLASALGRDMRSGRPLGGALEALLHNSRELMRSNFPAPTPVFGSSWQEILETARKPGNLRTGRVESVAERAIQEFFGARIRGHGDSLRIEGLSRWLLFLAGDPEAFTRTLRGTGGFSDSDLFAQAVYLSRRVDPVQAQTNVEFLWDNEERAFRSALDRIQSAQAAGNTAEVEIAQAQLHEAHEALRAKNRVAAGAGPEEDLRRDIAATLDKRNEELTFRRMSLTRKAYVITVMAAASSDEGRVNRLVDWVYWDPKGDLFRHSTPEQQRGAIRQLDEFLQRKPTGREVSTKRIVALRNYLSAYLPSADWEARVDRERAGTAAAVKAILEEVDTPPGE